jgi:quercetin dioxygenase-like cupin family protein
MKLPQIPFTVPDWANVPRTEHPGERGTSFWRTVEANGLRVRVVEYSPGFEADHWCPRGHVMYVLEGEVVLRLKDGREHRLAAGAGFLAGDDEANPHTVVSECGARVFLVD